MDELTDGHFDKGTAGAAKTYPVQCSALRKNGVVMLKGRPCRICEMSTSKTGKHGHAKVHLVGLDVITNKKYDDVCPSTHNMEVPFLTRKDYQLVDIEDDFLSLMDDKGSMKNDLKVPSGDIGKEIRDKHENGDCFMVTVLMVLDEEHAVGCKNMTQ